MINFVTDPFPSDAALRQLWLDAWGEQRESGFQPVLQRSLTHCGAYVDERLVGFVNVAWDGGIHAFIVDTCVVPEHRRQGIAARLVGQASAVARERGAVWLHVDYVPALDAFYRKCGFAPTAAGLMRLR